MRNALIKDLGHLMNIGAKVNILPNIRYDSNNQIVALSINDYAELPLEDFVPRYANVLSDLLDHYGVYAKCRPSTN